jgi:hypothetical protein
VFQRSYIIIMTKQKELSKAVHIKRTLGIRAAAGYMRNRGWSCEAAVWVLLGFDSPAKAESSSD